MHTRVRFELATLLLITAGALLVLTRTVDETALTVLRLGLLAITIAILVAIFS
jgi:hypothetical protein